MYGIGNAPREATLRRHIAGPHGQRQEVTAIIVERRNVVMPELTPFLPSSSRSEVLDAVLARDAERRADLVRRSLERVLAHDGGAADDRKAHAPAMPSVNVEQA